MQTVALMSDDELRVLDGALRSPGLGAASMDVCSLQGCATALVIGPRLIPPSKWLPWVWDADEGLAEPVFDSMALAAALTGEVMRLYNEVATAFAVEAPAFVPLFLRDPQHWRAGRWCAGFQQGIKLAYKDWSPLLVGAPMLFLPLNASDEAQTDAIAPAVLTIAAHWRAANAFAPGGPMPIRRDAAKLGRNDPCHCGSGLKYKKCHGLT